MSLLYDLFCSNCGRPVFLHDKGWLCSVNGTPLILETHVECGNCGQTEKGPRIFLRKETQEALKGCVRET